MKARVLSQFSFLYWFWQNCTELPDVPHRTHTSNKHIIWQDITGTVQYSAVITCKRQFVGMLTQLAKVSFEELTTSFAFGEKLFFGLLRLKISSFVESRAIPIALFLVFTVLTLALNSKVISTAMSDRLHELRCKQTDTSPTVYVITMRRAWLFPTSHFPPVFLSMIWECCFSYHKYSPLQCFVGWIFYVN